MKHTYKPTKMILTAGPSISTREIRYVTDAVKTGWNQKYRDYLTKFENTFAGYIGTKYAWSVSSGTGALHIALLACGIGKGDEVIVPEITFVASANAVKYVGATPVLVDVDPDTWCVDPTSVRKAITKRTKAIMPVHIYGHPADMDEINAIAKKYNLFVIEDACPSVGTLYKGRKTGSLGDIGAFSFQGAKIMVTGEGGMVTTNNKSLYDKMCYWGNHAKDHRKEFWHNEIGYMYRMSNIQGALGLAQLERIETFVAAKRNIFSWYKRELEDVAGITLNAEKPYARNIYWMTSIILDKNCGITRNTLRNELKKRMIDTRPFFYPISMFPMYKSKTKDNPVAYHIGINGINLPSGVNLTHPEVIYICNQMKDILASARKKTRISISPSYQKQIENVLHYLKHRKQVAIPDTFSTQTSLKTLIHGRIITDRESKKSRIIKLLATWRSQSIQWFPSQFRVTIKGTKRWADKFLLETPDRILFLLFRENDMNPFGHIGLYRFNYTKKTCELDNIIRGKNLEGTKGAMEAACKALMAWAYGYLGLKSLVLRVFSDNTRAVALYKRLGFTETSRVPLIAVKKPHSIDWEETKDTSKKTKRYFVTMTNKPKETF